MVDRVHFRAAEAYTFRKRHNASKYRDDIMSPRARVNSAGHTHSEHPGYGACGPIFSIFYSCTYGGECPSTSLLQSHPEYCKATR